MGTGKEGGEKAGKQRVRTAATAAHISRLDSALTPFPTPLHSPNAPPSPLPPIDAESPECTPATPELIARWLSLFRPCLQYAVDLGFDIAFTPHLDDGANSGQWRNAMRINPLERHEGVSYYDLVLRPLAEAMRDALRPGTYVSAAGAGEGAEGGGGSVGLACGRLGGAALFRAAALSTPPLSSRLNPSLLSLPPSSPLPLLPRAHTRTPR